MTPEIERALRLSPRLRKRLRERKATLLAALEEGRPEAILEASAAWGEAEKQAARDVVEKSAEPPMQRVSFLVEESYYKDFCETALEHELSPSEVARRYCLSGFTFSSILWETVRRGGSMGEWIVLLRRGVNLAQIALPNFSAKGPARTG